MTEKYYAFIKDNRVKNIYVFNEQNDDLANKIAQEQNYDACVWVGENKPFLHSLYDGKSFEAPTHEYLVEIGLTQPIIIDTNTTE